VGYGRVTIENILGVARRKVRSNNGLGIEFVISNLLTVCWMQRRWSGSGGNKHLAIQVLGRGQGGGCRGALRPLSQPEGCVTRAVAAGWRGLEMLPHQTTGSFCELVFGSINFEGSVYASPKRSHPSDRQKPRHLVSSVFLHRTEHGRQRYSPSSPIRSD